MIGLGIDVYGHVTLTSEYEDGVESGVSDLVDRLQAVDPSFPLRVVPLQIQLFSPVKRRLARHGECERSLAIQEKAVAAWNAELERRFDATLRGRSICDIPLANRIA